MPKGNTIIEGVNQVMKYFSLIAASQDWHPTHHCSFRAQGGPWPPHCIQNTTGAELHAGLDHSKIHLRIHKGEHTDRDAYSAFQETSLAEALRERKIKRVFVAGLATDYCVKMTALDALKNKFKTVILTDLVRAINARPGDGEGALRDIQRAGGVLTPSRDLENV